MLIWSGVASADRCVPGRLASDVTEDRSLDSLSVPLVAQATGAQLEGAGPVVASA